jgi:hypothetical protein
MTTESPTPQRTVIKNIYRNAGDAVYGLGFVGGAVYFIQHSATFMMGVFGVLKAIVWPALVVYRLLEFLKL